MSGPRRGGRVPGPTRGGSAAREGAEVGPSHDPVAADPAPEGVAARPAGGGLGPGRARAARGPRRILFVELLGGLGDVAIALPALQALARSHPLARCEALTFAPGAELLTHDPHVAAVHIAERGRAREAVERIVEAGRHDLVVSTTDTDGIGALIAARAPRAVTDLWRDPPADQRVEERLVALLVADGLVRPDAVGPARLFLAEAERARARASLPEGSGAFAALLIDAGMAIKRWPEARFADLGRRLRDRLGLAPLVVGGAEPAAARRVAEAIGARALPPMPLRELAAALARCAVAVGADTGPLRVAALAGTPSVMLFGPSRAGRYGLGAGHADLQARPACPERRVDFTEQRCWWSGACPRPSGPASCVGDVGAAEAEAAVAALLARAPRTGDGRASGIVPAAANRAIPSRGDVRPATAAARAPEDWPRDWSAARRVLVARLDNIGDVIMTGPALRAIALSWPGVHLGLWASPSGAQAAPLLPWIDEVRAERVPWQDLGALPFDPSREAAAIEGLREGRWDGAVILTSFSQSPHPAALACRRAGIALVAGASDEAGHALTHRLPKGERAMHQALRNLALARALGFGRGGEELALAVPPPARAEARALLDTSDARVGDTDDGRADGGEWLDPEGSGGRERDDPLGPSAAGTGSRPSKPGARRRPIPGGRPGGRGARDGGADEGTARLETDRRAGGGETPDDGRGGAARVGLADGRARRREPRAHLLVSPWASASARQYEPARMAEAARAIASTHGLRVVLTGAPHDRARGAEMARRIGPSALDLTGRTGVPEAAALVETAALVLCCNSSAMHMAEALGTPAVVLFAGTELPSQWAPRATPHRLLGRAVPCAPCHAFDCPMGHHACLDLDPAEVAAAAGGLLAGADPAGTAARSGTPAPKGMEGPAGMDASAPGDAATRATGAPASIDGTPQQRGEARRPAPDDASRRAPDRSAGAAVSPHPMPVEPSRASAPGEAAKRMEAPALPARTTSPVPMRAGASHPPRPARPAGDGARAAASDGTTAPHVSMPAWPAPGGTSERVEAQATAARGAPAPLDGEAS